MRREQQRGEHGLHGALEVGLSPRRLRARSRSIATRCALDVGRWLVLAAWGCGGAPPDADASAGAKAPARAMEAASPAPSEPVAKTTAEPVEAAKVVVEDPSVAPSVAVPPEPAKTLAFHPVVTSDEWLGLHPLLDGTLMISAGPKLLRVDPAGTIHDDPALLAGIELPWPEGKEHGLEAQMETIDERGGWSVLQVGGKWPTSTFLTLEVGGRRSATDYRWSGDRWVRAKHRQASYVGYPRTIRAWKDDSLLAWQELYSAALDLDDQCSQCPDEMTQTPEYRRAERELARAKQLVVLAGPAKGPQISDTRIVAFDALQSGEAFVAMQDGSLMVIPLAEEYWIVPPSATSGRYIDVYGLIARALDDVIAFGAQDGRPYLVRCSGQDIRAPMVELPPPPCATAIASLSIAGDTWWATCASPAPRGYEELNGQSREGTLWRRDDEQWQAVSLPDGLGNRARVVVARGVDDVWVSAYADDAVVLHTRARETAISLGPLKAIVREGFFDGDRERALVLDAG